MSSCFRPIVVFLSLVLSPGFPAKSAQTQSDRMAASSPHIQVNVDITLINAAVTGRDGRNVSGLTAGNFRVWEDKVKQKIEYFSLEDVPASVTLVLDVSSSMTTGSSLAREAALACLRTAKRGDEYSLVEFDSKPRLVADFTSDFDLLEQHISSASPKGSTALYDAVRFALEQLKNAHQRKKALLLITDGQDNVSRHEYLQTIEYLKEQNAEIYAIGISVDRYSRPSLRRRSGMEVLTGLTEATGGEALFPKSASDLPRVCKSIAEELKNQYVIGYRSSNLSPNGLWRKIKVQVDLPKGMTQLVVRTKGGYYGPRSAQIVRH
jgi:Ca-activated chloride channel family protein